MSAKKVSFDELRSLAFGSISGTYAAVGTPLAHPARIICFTNRTEGDMIFSVNNTSVPGQIIVPANSFKLYDMEANLNPEKDDAFLVGVGTQFYVKEIAAPVSGAVYIEVVYSLQDA
jgi:hypothetical protein